VVLIEILTFLILIPLHRKLLKKLRRLQETFVHQIDEIIYLLAKTQYASQISERDLGGDPHMAMMKEMFKSGHFEYLDNLAVIQANVEKVELLLQATVVSPEKWKEIHQLAGKLHRYLFRKKVIGWMASVPTLGIYKLFW
jgi:hypothetical protein